MIKLKTAAIFIMLFLITLFHTGFCVYAQTNHESDDYFYDQREASGADNLADELPDETKELLENLGIRDVDYNQIFNTSPKAVLKLISDMLKNGLSEPLKAAVFITAQITVIALGMSFIDSKRKVAKTVETAGSVMILLSAGAYMYDVINAAVSAVKLSSGFMLLLIPVLAALITASGSPAQALSYNSVAFLAAQGVTGLCSNFVLPIAGAVPALGVADMFMPSGGISSIADTVKKTVLWIFSSAAALFCGFLSLKGILAHSADSMAAKGVKLILSSAVPIVGSALSEAYGAISGSLSLLKNTVGVFGIIAISLINLPVIISLGVWTLATAVTGTFAQMLGVDPAEKILKALSSALILINVCVIFCAFVLIISTGITIVFSSK